LIDRASNSYRIAIDLARYTTRRALCCPIPSCRIVLVTDAEQHDSESRLVQVEGVSFHYDQRPALHDVSFAVASGSLFGLLGPNGGGKSTLLKLLATILPPQQGALRIGGFSVSSQPQAVRRVLGVTFQSPSLDRKLTVAENLMLQGRLYGLPSNVLSQRINEFSDALQIRSRWGDRVETLSGGLQRRVELAKSLLHAPRLLLLDEPSTGLDPAARNELWSLLGRLRHELGMTMIVSTHLLEEADRCEQLVILDRGQIVADGSPAALRAAVGRPAVTVRCVDPAALSQRWAQQYGWNCRVISDQQSVRIDGADAVPILQQLTTVEAESVVSATWAHPTLEDVFLLRTGRTFEAAQGGQSSPDPNGSS
jgi:ABC-2 type transport system ATP-binding protein